jgi:hypothetical protein
VATLVSELAGAVIPPSGSMLKFGISSDVALRKLFTIQQRSFHKEDGGIVGGKNENQLAHQFLPGGEVFLSKSAIHSLRSFACFAHCLATNIGT